MSHRKATSVFKQYFVPILASTAIMTSPFAHSGVVDQLSDMFSNILDIGDSHTSHTLDKNTANLIERIDQAIEQYEDIQSSGGWKPLVSDSTLALGEKSSKVNALITRLNITNDLHQHACLEERDSKQATCIFDEQVKTAVQHFQLRHGIKADGVIGHKTLAALNVPVETRIQQLKLNKYRLTQFSGLIDDEYVYVNIPEYHLRFISEGNVILKNKVVVGRPDWETPSMSDEIEKFVVNPTWKIPQSIAHQEIVPKVIDNPEYLEEKDIEIRKKSYTDDETIDPDSIDWDEITPNDFDYFLVKKAGKENPLGEVKYLFPNPDAIYVHDTPSKQWFNQTKRAASHGCIRMEDPFSLAQALAEQRSNEDLLQQIEEARTTGETTTFHLDKPVPIHLVYWTAWVDEKQRVNFRNDIYSRDDKEYALYIEQENVDSEKQPTAILNLSTGLSSL